MQPGPGTTTRRERYDWQRMSTSFSAIGLYSTYSMTLTGAGEPSRIDVANVTPGMFEVFNVTPALGRRISSSDTVAGAPNVALVSHDFWVSKLGSDPLIVCGGRTLHISFTRSPSSVCFRRAFMARSAGPPRLATL